MIKKFDGYDDIEIFEGARLLKWAATYLKL